jgi:hypothetical protein
VAAGDVVSRAVASYQHLNVMHTCHAARSLVTVEVCK